MTSVSKKFKTLQAEKTSAKCASDNAHKQTAHQEYLDSVSNMIEGMLHGLDDKITKAFNKAADSSVVYAPTLNSEIDLGFWSSHTESSDVEKFADLPAFRKLEKACSERGIAYEFNKERARNMVDDLNMFLKLTIHLSKTQDEAESLPNHGRYVKFC